LLYGFDQALQVSSGVAVLPERDSSWICPGFADARHLITPHVATVPASRMSDS
jgi:hypothetical protein